MALSEELNALHQSMSAMTFVLQAISKALVCSDYHTPSPGSMALDTVLNFQKELNGKIMQLDMIMRDYHKRLADLTRDAHDSVPLVQENQIPEEEPEED